MFLLLLQLAFASWPGIAIQKASLFQKGNDDLGFLNTYEASVWGSAKAKPYATNLNKSNRINVPHVFKNTLPYLYHFQSKITIDKETNTLHETTQRHPLIFYIPGIYNNINAAQSLRAYSDYKQLGYHIVILPNPWSTDYIKANAYGSKPGDILNEAKALFYAIQAILQTIDRNAIDGVELVGASYGGYIAGMISSFDEDNIFNRGTTIIGPPLDFRYSLPYMDNLMDTSLEQAYNLTYWELFQIGTNFVMANHASKLSEKSKANAKPFIAKEGFHNDLVNTIKLYSKIHKTNWVPKFSDSQEEIAWEKSIRFMKYFIEYAPEILPILGSEYASLNYWMQITLSQNRKVRLLSTADDFLNPPQFPSKKEFTTLPKEIYIELPSGGHLGFLAFPWYADFASHVWGDSAKVNFLAKTFAH